MLWKRRLSLSCRKSATKEADGFFFLFFFLLNSLYFLFLSHGFFFPFLFSFSFLFFFSSLLFFAFIFYFIYSIFILFFIFYPFLFLSLPFSASSLFILALYFFYTFSWG